MDFFKRLEPAKGFIWAAGEVARPCQGGIECEKGQSFSINSEVQRPGFFKGKVEGEGNKMKALSKEPVDRRALLANTLFPKSTPSPKWSPVAKTLCTRKQ